MKIETSEEALQVIKMIAEMQSGTIGYDSNTETTIKATKDKLLIQAIDGSQTCYVEAEIKTNTGIKEEETFGINSSDLAMVLRALRGNSLTIETTKNELKIQAGDNKDKSELTLFLEPAHDLKSPQNSVNQIKYTQIVKIKEIQGFRTALKLAGLADEKTVKFETTKDNIFQITASGTRGTFKRRIEIKSDVHAKGLKTISAFNRELLLQVIKAKANEIQFHLANNKPILIEYELGQAKTKIWIAPKLMEYDNNEEEEIETKAITE